MKCHHGQLLPHQDLLLLLMQAIHPPPQDLKSLPRDFGPLSLCLALGTSGDRGWFCVQ